MVGSGLWWKLVVQVWLWFGRQLYGYTLMLVFPDVFGGRWNFSLDLILAVHCYLRRLICVSHWLQRLGGGLSPHAESTLSRFFASSSFCSMSSFS